MRPRSKKREPIEHAMLARPLPQNLEAEAAVIGGCLLKPRTVAEVQSILSPSDFYSPAHRLIYEAVLSLFQENAATDMIAVSERLGSRGQLEEAGGVPIFGALVESPISMARAVYHARLVRECAARREVIQGAADAIELAYSPSSEVSEVQAALARAAADSSEARTRGIVSASDAVRQAMPMVRELWTKKTRYIGIPTPFTRLNEVTSGLAKGTVTILAGDTGLGKTALALAIALHAAKAGTPVLYFSMEMRFEELVWRNIASLGGVEAKLLRGMGQWADEDKFLAEQGAQELAALPLHIIDWPVNAGEFAALCRLAHQRFGVGLVVLDYIQRMVIPRDIEKRHAVDEISWTCKTMAQALNVPILALSQFNRKADERGHTSEPKLSDLKESSGLEQDADTVLLIWEDKKQPWEPGPEESRTMKRVNLRVRKNRHGPDGAKLSLIYHRRYLRFTEEAEGQG